MKILTVLRKEEAETVNIRGILTCLDCKGFVYLPNRIHAPLSLGCLQRNLLDWQEALNPDGKLVAEFDVDYSYTAISVDEFFTHEKHMLEYRRTCVRDDIMAGIEIFKLKKEALVATYKFGEIEVKPGDVDSRVIFLEPHIVYNESKFPLLSCRLYYSIQDGQCLLDGNNNITHMSEEAMTRWRRANGSNGYLDDWMYSEAVMNCNGHTLLELRKMLGNVSEDEKLMTIGELKQLRGVMQ